MLVMTIEIREATRDDLPSILSLYSQLGMDSGEVLSLNRAKELYDKLQSYPDYKLYIALHNSLPVGALALLIMDNLGHQGASSGVVEDVVVRRDVRGQGIGKQMMEFAMQKCREKGCYKITLSSNMHRTEAHKFYKSLGYQRHGYSFFTDLHKEDARP
jgi:ribosomal protein S18 acetylase RimI-like enzyme